MAQVDLESAPFGNSMSCFASGTLIRTGSGDVAVEKLSVGDKVVTTSGAVRPVAWMGHRTIDLASCSDPKSVWPVRVAKDAFGPNLPAADLLLSPGHSVCVTCLDEVLVPVGELVSGATVTRLEADAVTYWYVELDAHDILYANGLPVESCNDVGNRAFFAGGTSAPDADRAVPKLVESCRPLCVDPVIVGAVRYRLGAQARQLGWTLGDVDVALCLEVDGVTIMPRMVGNLARFLVPATARDVWLVSKTFNPGELDISPDPRTLGVRLVGIAIDDGLRVKADIALDDPMLRQGFHAPEVQNDVVLRWTNGRCRLPAELWDRCAGEFFLKVTLSSNTTTGWMAPDGEAGDHAPSRPRPGLRLVEPHGA